MTGLTVCSGLYDKAARLSVYKAAEKAQGWGRTNVYQLQWAIDCVNPVL
jgi:hypothetical protein